MHKNLINIWVDPFVRKEPDEDNFWFNFSTLDQLKQFMILVEEQQIKSFESLLAGFAYSITLNYYEADGTMKFKSFEAIDDPFILRLNICSSMTDVVDWVMTEQKDKPHETVLHDFTYSIENCYFYKKQKELNLSVEKDNLNCLGVLRATDKKFICPECKSCRFFSEKGRNNMTTPGE